MMPTKLTQRAAAAADYSGVHNTRCVVWDTEVPGFGLRIYPSGRKAWLLSYRAQGRKRLLTLASFGVLTLKQARDQARQQLAVLLDGVDPADTRQKERSMQSFSRLCDDFLDHAREHKKTAVQDARRIEKYLRPRWGSRQASAISHNDAVQLHREIGKSARYQANRVLALVRRMFVLGAKWGFVDPGHQNPAAGVEKYREEERDRFVGHDEMPNLREAINQEPNIFIRAALNLLILTALRKSELLAAKWEDINWQTSELRIQDTKSNRTHYAYLSKPARAILEELPRIEDTPYIFAGNKPGHSLVNVSKAWQRVRERAGCTDVRLHDLRRTTGSWMAQLGYSLPLVGEVLNHRSTETTKIYARFARDSAHNALERIGEDFIGDGRSN